MVAGISLEDQDKILAAHPFFTTSKEKREWENSLGLFDYPHESVKWRMTTMAKSIKLERSGKSAGEQVDQHVIIR